MCAHTQTHTHIHTRAEGSKKALRLFIAKLNVIIFHLIILPRCIGIFFCHAHTITSGRKWHVHSAQRGWKWGAWAWHCLVACGIDSFGAISLNCRAGVGIGNRPTLIAACGGGACNNLWHVTDWLATNTPCHPPLPLSHSLFLSLTNTIKNHIN